MKILGFIMGNPLLVMTLAITMGLFISLPIKPTGENILDESTYGSLENLREKNAK